MTQEYFNNSQKSVLMKKKKKFQPVMFLMKKSGRFQYDRV